VGNISIAAFCALIMMKTTTVSVKDYTHFHGMLCAPATARRCIESFDGGTILFMPSQGYFNDIEKYDCTRPVLTMLSYYFLVLASFTGLSTLLRQTTIHVARDEEMKPIKAPAITANHNAELIMNQTVIDYIKQRQSGSTDFYLKRRFEYHFGGLLPLSVVMFHLSCNRNKLHLVEIYKFDNEWQRRIFQSLSDIALTVWRKFCS